MFVCLLRSAHDFFNSVRLKLASERVMKVGTSGENLSVSYKLITE